MEAGFNDEANHRVMTVWMTNLTVPGSFIWRLQEPSNIRGGTVIQLLQEPSNTRGGTVI